MECMNRKVMEEYKKWGLNRYDLDIEDKKKVINIYTNGNETTRDREK